MRSKNLVTISTLQELISSPELNQVMTQIARTDGNGTTPAEKDEYKTIDTLLFFVGYPRSRHTLMASLLDAHPHMIVANENNLFYRLKNGKKYERSQMFDTLIEGSKGFLKGGKGIVMKGNLQNTSHFGFWMEGYWQGSYDKYIKVIGDKTAWMNSGVFRSTTPEDVTKLVDDIEKKYRVKVKFIHMMRNPFDIVSTIVLRNTKEKGGRFKDHSQKVDDPKLLEESMERFFNWAQGSAIAREVLGDKLLDVDGLKLVNKPIEYMSKVCQFIEIACSDEYLMACAEVVDSTPSTTRDWVVWSKEHKNRMYSEFEKYPFLAHYSFDD